MRLKGVVEGLSSPIIATKWHPILGQLPLQRGAYPSYGVWHEGRSVITNWDIKQGPGDGKPRMEGGCQGGS